MDSKYLQIRMPDGSKWQIPFTTIIRHLVDNDEELLAEDYMDARMTEAKTTLDDSVIMQYARDEMNWSDVQDDARQLEAPTTIDYEQAWITEETEMIDHNY